MISSRRVSHYNHYAAYIYKSPHRSRIKPRMKTKNTHVDDRRLDICSWVCSKSSVGNYLDRCSTSSVEKTILKKSPKIKREFMIRKSNRVVIIFLKQQSRYRHRLVRHHIIRGSISRYENRVENRLVRSLQNAIPASLEVVYESADDNSTTAASGPRLTLLYNTTTPTTTPDTTRCTRAHR